MPKQHAVAIEDTYRVLPHRDIKLLLGRVSRKGERMYEHLPCQGELSESDVKEANWCQHCAATINKAARRRGQEHIVFVSIESPVTDEQE